MGIMVGVTMKKILGEFNEQIEDVEEELFADTQLSLEGVLV